MALISLKEALFHASQKEYAIGAFNVDNHDSTEGILAAAEQRNLPVILNLAQVHFDLVDMAKFMPYLMERIRSSPVPIVLNLDHGSSFEGVMRSIHYGFSSVMFDGSTLPLEENIRQAKEIVKVAHAVGVSVEAELGHVAGLEGGPRKMAHKVDRGAFTAPDEAKIFVEETGIDALAVAVGTVHGTYKGEPELDFELLETIKNTVSVPLVLHGGSGLSPDDFKRAIKHGIRKINYHTGLIQAALGVIEQQMIKTKGNATFAELTAEARKQIAVEAGVQMEIFGTLPI